MKEHQAALTNLIAGGGAGIAEAVACHPLDTVKTRMQLQRKGAQGDARAGLLRISRTIAAKEGLLAFYGGLSAVVLGMGPKMAIRFTSFEVYKDLLPNADDAATQSRNIFIAGLAAGITEAVSVVNPMEVLKIRLQAQNMTPAQGAVASNGSTALSAGPNLVVVLRNTVSREGVTALWKGVGLTALRQGTNQAVNFTVYSALKSTLQRHQPDKKSLPSWQTASIGLISGAMGPLCNAPIDTVKTRIQNSTVKVENSRLAHAPRLLLNVVRQEGVAAMYKGITPRILRVAPGQAVTFTVYEFLKGLIQS